MTDDLDQSIESEATAESEASGASEDFDLDAVARINRVAQRLESASNKTGVTLSWWQFLILMVTIFAGVLQLTSNITDLRVDMARIETLIDEGIKPRLESLEQYYAAYFGSPDPDGQDPEGAGD